MIVITITNRQKTLRVDRRRMRSAIRAILRDAQIVEATISIALVDDATIAQLHDEYLDDPDPTDVLSFVLEPPPALEGEVIASADTAKSNAKRYACDPEEELLRYAIHGVLHLVGYDDISPSKRAVMKKKERHYLANP